MRRRRALELLLSIAAAAAAPLAPAAPPELELNQASRAQLESLPGIGPALAERLLAARSQGLFDGWADLRRRVRGIGPVLARRLSDQGLRVAGQAWPG
ncbi:MAG: helix-hairpin-helix domain-containing protein [Burkholderiaceae bacterium]